MNAPAKAKDLAPANVMQLIAVDDITPSDTHIQQLRRSRFDQAAMAELIKSVEAQGVLQPIVVRRNPNVGPAGPEQLLWQIVAGERRFLAARAAKLQAIPAVCRDLTDLQVLEIQLTENLQREGLHPLEEAEGYRELMQLKSITADTVAEEIGKSRSYVYGRLKLLDLQDAARDAFYDGSLDASKALELARIKDPKKQAQLLAAAVEVHWNGSTMSVRDLKRTIEASGFVKPLAGAAFDPESDLLFRFLKARRGVDDTVMLPACSACTQRAGEGSAADPYVCTDVSCFDDKVKDTTRRKRLIAEGAGRTVLTGDAARAMLQGKHAIGDVVDLDEECDFDGYPVPEPDEPDNQDDDAAVAAYNKAMDAWDLANDAHKPRSYRQMLADAPAIEPILVEDPKTRALVEVVPMKDALRVAQAKGIEVPAWMLRKAENPLPPDTAPQRETDEERRIAREKEQAKLAAELAHRRAVLAAIHAKWKGPFKREDWLDVATGLWEGGDASPALNALYGDADKDPPFAQMKEPELQRFIIELLVCGCCDDSYHSLPSPAALFALAKRHKIDPVQVKKDMAAKAKAKDKPAATKAPAKKNVAKK